MPVVVVVMRVRSKLVERHNAAVLGRARLVINRQAKLLLKHFGNRPER